MNDSPEVPVLSKPCGLALVTCCKITWDNTADAASRDLNCPRDISRTYDTWTVEGLPRTVGPVAAYVLVTGAGKTLLSLMLEAPNGEIVVAYHKVVTSWGILGTWEWVVHVSEILLSHLGIYHWQLCHGDDVLLDRPMLVKLRS